MRGWPGTPCSHTSTNAADDLWHVASVLCRFKDNAARQSEQSVRVTTMTSSPLLEIDETVSVGARGGGEEGGWCVRGIWGGRGHAHAVMCGCGFAAARAVLGEFW